MLGVVRGFIFIGALIIYFASPCYSQTASTGFVVEWGDNTYGQTNVPANATNIVALATGYLHSLALTDKGRVIAWGAGQTNSGPVPNSGQSIVPSDLTNAIAVAAGLYHSLALKSNGTVIAWGAGSANSGQNFGQSTVPSGLSNVTAIAACWNNSSALRADGTVVAWGANSSGQTNVPPNVTNIVAIADCGFASMALRADGMVFAWGFSTYGQTNMPSGLSNVVAISGGLYHCLALKDNGTVVAWGAGRTNAGSGADYGQSIVPIGLSNVVAISAGEFFSLALQRDGTMVGWGQNDKSQLYAPAQANIFAIGAGAHNTGALISRRPRLLAQPPERISLTIGLSTNLVISVSGEGPFGCQWSFNGTPILGATGTSFGVADFDQTNAGAYSVTVSNEFGYTIATTFIHLLNSPIIFVDGAEVEGGVVSRIESSQITMNSTLGVAGQIYYTLDGSTPDFTGNLYVGSFNLTNDVTLRTIGYNSAYTEWEESIPIYIQIVPTYPVSGTTAGGGFVTLSPGPYSGQNRYVSNTIITIAAVPSEGWSFIRWTGDSTEESSVATITVDHPSTVQAVFGTFVNLFTNGSGRIYLDPPAGPYPFGTSAQITALPSTGYYLFGWANSASGFANPLSLTFTNAVPGITALFGALKSNQVSFTALPIGKGTLLTSPAKNVYTNGDTISLTALPATNWSFTSWSGDASGSLNPLSLTLGGSKVINATFVAVVSTNQPPRFQGVGATNGMIVLTWSSIAGFKYQLQFKTTWDQVNWTSLSAPVVAVNGNMTATDSIASGATQRWYRVVELP